MTETPDFYRGMAFILRKLAFAIRRPDLKTLLQSANDCEAKAKEMEAALG